MVLTPSPLSIIMALVKKIVRNCPLKQLIIATKISGKTGFSRLQIVWHGHTHQPYLFPLQAMYFLPLFIAGVVGIGKAGIFLENLIRGADRNFLKLRGVGDI